MTFEEIATHIRDSPIKPVDPGLLACLKAPQKRLWFDACRAWVKGCPSPDDFPEIKSRRKIFGDAYDLSIAEAHIECACLALNPAFLAEDGKQVLTEELKKIVAESAETAKATVKIGFLRDLVQEFLSEAEDIQPRKAQRYESITALLVEEKQIRNDKVKDGVIVTLTLDLMPDGNGELYPHTSLAFVARDDLFRSAEANARDYVKTFGFWGEGHDVRWNIARRDDEPLPLEVVGNSAGAAFAMGMAKLLAAL